MSKSFTVKSLKPQANICVGCHDCCMCAQCRDDRDEIVERHDWTGDQYDRLRNFHFVWWRERSRANSFGQGCGGQDG